MSEIRVVSSLDSPLAIAEAFRLELRDAHDVCIASPWLQNCAVHLLKRTVSKGAKLDMLIGKPKIHDSTYRALEALDSLSEEMRWRFNCVLMPTLHAKFHTVDHKDVLVGSPNVTNGGLYENNEVMVCFHDMPNIVDRFTKIFEIFREQPGNIGWELFRDFHGSSVDRRLVEITLAYMRRIRDREVKIPLLISEYRRQGYSFDRAKEGFLEMEKSGFIYTTSDGFAILNPKYEF
jgi:phosphatidylserine/phosphatidylglycerophosphate/cardiolipin synthase-like enzyme